MIRRHGSALRLALALADALVAVALVLVVSEIRLGHNWPRVWGELIGTPWAPFVLFTTGWLIALWSQGLYRLRTRWTFGSQALATLRAAIAMGLVTFAVLFLLNLPDVSRLFLLLLIPSLAVGSMLLRAIIHLFLIARRRHGGNLRNVIVVGSGPSATHFARELEAHPALGLRIVGYVNGEADQPSMGWPHLGPIDSLEDVFHSSVVDEVALCLDLADWAMIHDIVELSRAEGKIVRMPLAGSIFQSGTTHVEHLSGIPVLSISQGPDRQLALAIKRVIDVVGAAMGLLVTAPILAVCAAAIILDSGRPVFFSQERVGLHGRRFRMLKMRTMVRGAEELLPDLRSLNEIEGQAFKLTDDPRITRVGRFLRRTSLDELPQLWNVLTGAMSLVGPRPPMPSEVSGYDVWHRRRLSMKPGITGLWQVHARGESDFDRWVEKDLEYIDNWSLWLDAQIVLRTLPAVLRLEGR
jgi:exopolysaccharide biosynthesis polyprenyl glycosylphosphotransferase